MNLDISKAQIIGLLVTLVLPVLVGLVTTRVTSAGVKAVLLLLLTAANGFLVELGRSTARGIARKLVSPSHSYVRRSSGSVRRPRSPTTARSSATIRASRPTATATVMG